MSAPATADQRQLLDKIMEEALHKDRHLFDSLSEHERLMVVDWLAEAVVTGQTETALTTALWEVDFLRRPVSPKEFIESEEYIGLSMSNIYPMWKDVLCHVLEPKNQIVEFILTGAIGVGKTFATTAALAYKVYWLSCLRDPARYYGLSSKSKIVFGFYAITKKQASDVGYYRLRSYFEHSPYFQNHFPYNPRLETKTQFIQQPIEVIFGSKAFHSLGMDLLGFAIDEANFFQDKKGSAGQEGTNLAKELYDSASSRLYSRFMRPGGVLPGLVCLPSSRNASNSFLEEEIAKKKNNKNVFIADYALWEVKGKHKYFLPKFHVQVGDRSSPSKVLNNPEVFALIDKFATGQMNEAAVKKAAAEVDYTKEEKPKEGKRVVEVPGEYLSKFVEDTDQALRDIAGVATFNVSPLIRDRESVFDCISPELAHPFSAETVTLDIETDFNLEEVFDLKRACRIDNGKWIPRLNARSLRFIHVDLAINGDCAGIAMCHASHSVRIKQERPDGTLARVTYPFVVFDFMLRISPPKGSEIDHGKIRSFLLYLRDLYPIKSITYDGFQSAASIQVLRKAGVNSRVLSCDRGEDPYLALRAGLHERRVMMYRYEPFIDEVLDLQRDIKTHKVDHPVKATKGGKGSKDVADGAAGAYYDCMEDEDNLHHEVAGTWGVVGEYRKGPGDPVVPLTLPMPQAPQLEPTQRGPNAPVRVHLKPTATNPHAIPPQTPQKVGGVAVADLEAGL